MAEKFFSLVLSDALLLEASKKAVKHIKLNDGISLGGYTLPKMSYLEFRAKKNILFTFLAIFFFRLQKWVKCQIFYVNTYLDLKTHSHKNISFEFSRINCNTYSYTQ